MKGFRPKNQQAWDLRDGSDGCVRSSKMDCRSDGFMTLKNMKLPESSKGYVYDTLSTSECGEICTRNCSCVAYANTEVTGSGSVCVIWVEDLLDMRQYNDSIGGLDLYVRVSASELAKSPQQASENGSGNNIVKIVSITMGVCAFVIMSFILFYLRRKKLHWSKNPNIQRKGPQKGTHDYFGEMTTDELELPVFDYTTLGIATNSFCDTNKLGQGGFGCVYKGILEDGQVVAVKRLSKTSGQGIEELKNEVRLIAKLQHRNLVRLVGCCIEVEEKLLVYEYMEHKSLDMFLFDKQKSAQLDWQKRFEIISGIVRGLLYLHQDSSNALNLIGHTWNLWREGNALELLDESIGAGFSHAEVLKCIQIGLLCVQEHAKDRPTMSKVLLMLSSDDTNLPQPKYPGFCLERRNSRNDLFTKQEESLTLNDVTLTIPEGR
ncbi:hypothetical protein QVD17_17917 [Tagetes erecta]|uniref:non-specific serine/threonine protein kinase n=1 Tax=Tagetes erecta TaxID=13708 RepID=A0AAD8KJP6_TARER|nr:hypothetical protein QVD17_17917 [Tagetes erecta]